MITSSILHLLLVSSFICSSNYSFYLHITPLISVSTFSPLSLITLISFLHIVSIPVYVVNLNTSSLSSLAWKSHFLWANLFLCIHSCTSSFHCQVSLPTFLPYSPLCLPEHISWRCPVIPSCPPRSSLQTTQLFLFQLQHFILRFVFVLFFFLFTRVLLHTILYCLALSPSQ